MDCDPVQSEMDEEKVQDVASQNEIPESKCEVVEEEEGGSRDAADPVPAVAAASADRRPDHTPSDHQSECEEFDPETVVSEAAFWHVSCDVYLDSFLFSRKLIQ